MSVDTSGLAYNESNLTGMWKKKYNTQKVAHWKYIDTQQLKTLDRLGLEMLFHQGLKKSVAGIILEGS